jgi:hypothetical protein
LPLSPLIASPGANLYAEYLIGHNVSY